MKNNFPQSLQLVLKDEGGYSNDPADSGGPTNYGITIKDVQLYVKKGATADDVRALTVEQASNIYKSKYWDALGCDDLPSGVDYTCFDYGVNSGLGRPRAALKTFKDKSGLDLINAINDERVTFLKSISHGKNSKFLKGWLNRVSRVRTVSTEMNKKNNVTGPASAVLVGGVGTGAVLMNHSLFDYVSAHPYLSVSIGVAAVALVGGIVHAISNWNK